MLKIQASRYRLRDTGFEIQDSRYRLQNTSFETGVAFTCFSKYRLLNTGSNIQAPKHSLEYAGSKTQARNIQAWVPTFESAISITVR